MTGTVGRSKGRALVLAGALGVGIILSFFAWRLFVMENRQNPSNGEIVNGNTPTAGNPTGQNTPTGADPTQPGDSERYNIPELYKLYSVEPDNLTITSKYSQGQIKRIDRMNHQSMTAESVAQSEFNRGVRRERTLLVAGDMPRVGMATTWPLKSIDPPIVKMGEFSISIRVSGMTYDVMEADTITARHLPEGTEWIVEFEGLSPLSVTIRAIILDENSISLLVKTSGAECELMARYDRFALIGRNMNASYFGGSNNPVEQNAIFMEEDGKNAWRVSFDPQSGMRETIGVHGISSSELKSHAVSGGVEFHSLASLENELAIIAFHSMDGVDYDRIKADAHGIDQMEKLYNAQRASSEYYEHILSQAQSFTGSSIMDLAFSHAVLNHDYGHIGRAWLEGGHWWACYWTNNYQISAAISLGQYERAREALRFFGTIENGYGVIRASGEGDGGFDGLPYYIYQLNQYIQHTGDTGLLEEVLPFVDTMVEKMYALNDLDGNGLLSWQLHANAFLYQADHLQLPGDAASPSLMMTGMLDILGHLAEKAGNRPLAEKYMALSKMGSENLIPQLWAKERGFFFSHKDNVGMRHTSHYYTDFVFPSLYSTMDARYGWSSLDQLLDSLTFRSKKSGLMLMRVGDYKPSIFGNDNVMPVQMAEAARALLQEGYVADGVRLMEAVAYGSTVYTESPGSFPERLNDDGKGEANYMFGNPYGSYIHSYVNGLWGVEVSDYGRTLCFSPRLPADWTSGSIRLGYADIRFEGAGNHRKFIIKAGSDTVRRLEIKIPVHSAKGSRLLVNGMDFSCDMVPINGWTLLAWAGDLAGTVEVDVVCDQPVLGERTHEYLFGDLEEDGEYLQPGLHYTYELDEENQAYIRNRNRVHSPFSLTEAEIKKTNGQVVLKGQGEAYGFRGETARLSLEIVSVSPHIEKSIEIPVDQDGHFKFDVDLGVWETSISRAEVDCAISYGDREYRDVIDASVQGGYNNRQVNIDTLLTDTVIYALSSWREELYSVSIKGFSGTGLLDVFGEKFRILTEEDKARALMSVVNKDISDKRTGELMGTLFNESITMDVHDSAGSISLLFVDEVQARNTKAVVATLTIHYTDGTRRAIDLESGKQIDALFGTFASECDFVQLSGGGGQDYANVLRVGCDASKVIGSIEITGKASDAFIGLIAINLG